jgi:hypothetical protein
VNVAQDKHFSSGILRLSAKSSVWEDNQLLWLEPIWEYCWAKSGKAINHWRFDALESHELRSAAFRSRIRRSPIQLFFQATSLSSNQDD